MANLENVAKTKLKEKIKDYDSSILYKTKRLKKDKSKLKILKKELKSR